jgi:hypothetical protein
VTVLDRVPVDRISVQATALRLLPVLLSILMAPFFVLGWTAARLWLAVRWMIAAVVVGFKVGLEGGARAG